MLMLCLGFEAAQNMTVKGKIIAYCDLFNTKMTGFFTYYEEAGKYRVLYYENAGSYLNPMGAATSPEAKLTEHDLNITLQQTPVAAYCQDFSKNNYNDLLLVFYEHTYSALFYFYTADYVFAYKYFIDKLAFRPYPLNIADRGVSDLVFLNSRYNYLEYVYNMIIDDLQACLDVASSCFSETKVLAGLSYGFTFSETAFLYHVDLSGDCTGEYAVPITDGSRVVMQFLAKNVGQQNEITLFELWKFELGTFVGIPYFFDVNTNSNMDLIVPVCFDNESSRCELRVYYNLGKLICSSTGGRDCRSKSYICTADPGWAFSTKEGDFDAIYIPEIDLESYISAYDYNLQRAPSIFVATKNGVFEVNTTADAQLKVVRGASLTSGTANNELSTVEMAQFTHVHPIDFIGRGWFVFAFSSATETRFYTHPKFPKLGFFLKAQMLTDLCFDKCAATEPRRSYSTFVPGATLKYVTSDVSNAPKTGVMTVLGQPGFVELPYAEFGVATVSYYIDYFAAGASGRWQQFSGIVPNSALWVVSGGHTWKVVVYLEDVSRSMFSVAVATALIFVCFCALLSALVWWQNKSDKKEAALMNEYFE